MPKRIGDVTRLTLPLSTRLFNFAHYRKLMGLSAYQLAKDLGAGGRCVTGGLRRRAAGMTSHN
jgi:hypothetical protein